MPQFPYYNLELSRGENNPSESTIYEIIDILEDSRLQAEIAAGNVSLAMIRPNVGPEANVLGLPDIEASNEIEGLIQNLGFTAKFSFRFNKEAVEEFYGGDPRDGMSKGTAKDSEKYSNRWLEFVDFMTSGPTTAILLFSPNGDAIPLWRSHLGHWNIDKERDPNTIRGKLGVDKFNNLVHGSDSPQSVSRELEIIKSCLRASLED